MKERDPGSSLCRIPPGVVRLINAAAFLNGPGFQKTRDHLRRLFGKPESSIARLRDANQRWRSVVASRGERGVRDRLWERHGRRRDEAVSGSCHLASELPPLA